VTILTHCSYAMLFARKVIETFNHISKCFDCCQFWSATGGELSISAGILYAPVNLPLSSAISYAETLLASAKSKGRRLRTNAKGQPSPACLDWESVTDGLLDSVHDRRQRELLFIDKACNRTIELTKRPYTMKELGDLDKLRDKLEGIPASIRYEVLPSLRATLDDRLAYYARIRKSHPELAGLLQEPWQANGGRYGDGWAMEEGDRQTTGVIDALLCLEEENRMSKEKQTV